MAPNANISSVDAKLNAVTQPPQPKITGAIVAEDANSLTVKSGDAVIEIPTRHILGRVAVGSSHELTLAPDAQILVSTVVSANSGFVGNNVFGALLPHFLADNCNCNCNCSGGGSEGGGKIAASPEISKPFTGGARNR